MLLGVVVLAILFGPLRWVSRFQEQRTVRGMFADQVTATGYLQAPVHDLNFSSTVTGLVSNIYVQLGQQVVAGQLLSHLGYHTYVAQLRAAEVAVDVGRNELLAAEVYVAKQPAFIGAQVALAQTMLRAELNNRLALLQQAQANLHFEQVTLAEDQRVLKAVIAASDAAIKSAKQTEENAIAACKAATPTATASSTDSGSSSLSSASTCIKAAKDAFQAAVTAAKQAVVMAQGMVAQDQAAVLQANADAKVNLTKENEQINEARVSIDVARFNPDRTNAIIALTADEFTYRTALAALLVAQQTLALTNLYAPCDGTVTAIIGTIGGVPGAVDNLIPAGGLESQGEEGGFTFIQVTDTKHVNRVMTYVDQDDIYKVHPGQTATFTVKAYGNHQFTGRVIQIAPNGLGYPGSPTSIKYVTTIAIDGDSVGSYALYHHMTANVSIAT